MELTLKEKIERCYQAVIDKKGDNVVILDLKKITSFTDYFLICSGSSTKQVQSIADEIIRRLGKEEKKETRIEGYQVGRWILVDCIDVVIHVFHEETRNFYNIERLWGDAAKVKIAMND